MQSIHNTISVPFHCQAKIGRKQEYWEGIVSKLTNHGSHYEIHISSRSGFIFVIGKYHGGNFISVPTFSVGCDLAHYDDFFWNCERLSKLMSKVDAATIATSLKTLAEQKYI